MPASIVRWVGQSLGAEHRVHRLALAALALGIALRLILVVLNADANDNHIEVIQAMAFAGWIPGVDDMWQGFQPKLYHMTVAAIWQVMPEVRLGIYIRVAQLVSCFAGIATLLITWRFLLELTVRPGVRTIAMSLAALNPKLLGIHAQATNDAFVIFFCTLALFAMWRFMRVPGARSALIGLAALVGATVSKGNAIPIICTVALILTVGPLLHAGDRSRRWKWPLLACLMLAAVVGAGALDEYGRTYQTKGSPFATNRDRMPWPAFFEKTTEFPSSVRPGVRSIADSVFTFRLVDMLRNPITWARGSTYPEHRTSIWSQVYGNAHSVHFDGHPDSWRSWQPEVIWTTRAILVLALPATAVLLAGFVLLSSGTLIEAVRRRPPPPLENLLLVVAVGSQLSFLVLYCMRIRNFGTMKAIFIAPALLGFVWCFAIAGDRLSGWLAGRPRLVAASLVWLATLLLAYVIDIGILIRDLAL